MNQGIPQRFPARLSDYLVDYISEICDMMIQMELHFDGRLDADRLAQAADLVLDAEPVLGCRLVNEHRRRHWERLEQDKRPSFLLVHDESEYENFKSSQIDAYAGPQIKACLWHTPDGDSLLLKVAHQVADIGGVKELTAILSNIYRRLASDPGYRPEPNIKGSRSFKQVIRHIPWYAYPHRCLGVFLVDLPIYMPHTNQTLPCPDGPREPLAYIHHLIPGDRVSAIVDYGHAHNATINDIIVTAALHALTNIGNWDRRSHLSIETTLDFRRYIPSGRAEAITNLSTMVFSWPSLGTDPGRDFGSALDRLAKTTRYGKAHWISLETMLIPFVFYILCRSVPGSVGLKFYQKLINLGYSKHVPEHTFSNAGPIAPESVTFDTRPTMARILPPTFYPPIPLLFSLTGYNGTLTLSAGVYPTQKDIAEKFFDAILKELPS